MDDGDAVTKSTFSLPLRLAAVQAGTKPVANACK